MWSVGDIANKIQSYSAEQCSNIVTKPNSEIYYALKLRMQKCDPPWIQSFVDHYGLNRLVDTLLLLSQDRQKAEWTSVCDAILQLDCIGCVREVLNVPVGMEYLVQNHGDLVNKLVLALDTPNVYPKKQLFELLTCIAIASQKGHHSILIALENYQKVKHQAHLLTVIIHEMKIADNTHYRTTLMAFINALIQCTTNITARCRVRNQLIGLKILDVLNFMKKDEKDAEFCVQMQVFYNNKQKDEAEITLIHNMDFQSPLHVFEVINENLTDKPEACSFLHVLQDIYRMDTTSCDRSLLWQTLEKITYAISNLGSEKDSQFILARIYAAIDAGIMTSRLGNNIVNEKQCESSFRSSSSNDSIPLDEDELMDVLSSSPDFTSYTRSLSGGSVEYKFPLIDSDANVSDRRDSGVSLRSNPSPGYVSSGNNSGNNYSDYDNLGDGGSFPSSDISWQDQHDMQSSSNVYNGSGIFKKGNNNNRRQQQINNHREFLRQYPHILPAIEETEQESFDDDNATEVIIQPEQDNNKQKDSKDDHKFMNGTTEKSSDRNEFLCDSMKIDPDLEDKNNTPHGNNSENDKEGQLIRPRSLEIVKQTVRTEMYNVEDADGRNMVGSYKISRPKSLDSVDQDTNNLVSSIQDNNNTGKRKEVSLLKKMFQNKKLPSQYNNGETEASAHICTKDVKWVRLSEAKTQVPMNMWKQMKDSSSGSNVPIDFKKLQKDFINNHPQKLQSPDDELNLLNAETSLAISLFLARLETNPEFVAECVREGDLSDLGIEGVRHLVSVLPSEEEINQLKSYTDGGGSMFDLAPPEQLLLLLGSIPGYRLQLDTAVFHSDFNDNFFRLNEAFEVLLKACKDTVNCDKLRDFMEFCMRVGNFLNKDNYIGKVDGIALSTWYRMSQVTGSNFHNNLLNWIIQHIDDGDENLFMFIKEIPTLEKASSCNIEEMKGEVNDLSLQMKKFINKLSCSPLSIRNSCDKIVEGVTKNLQILQDQIQSIKFASQQLMIYLGEDEATFDVQVCLKTLYDFISLVMKLKMESEDRHMEKQMAGIRMKQMIDQQIDQYFSDIFDHEVSVSTTPPAPKRTIGLVDRLLEKLHHGEIEPNYIHNHQGTDYEHLQSFFMPEHEEDRFSPDREVAPIVPCHSTPSKPDESLLEIPELQEIQEKKTYADRADRHLKGQYRKDMQALSSSFTILSPSNEKDSSNKKNIPIKLSTVVPEVSDQKNTNSRTNNLQDMDIILMDLDTCVDRVNNEIIKLENAKREKLDNLDGNQQSNIHHGNSEASESRSDNSSGVKFYFGLPTPEDTKKVSTECVIEEDSTKGNKDVEDNKNKALSAEDKPNKSKPTSKLGILKRFSKAVLRQRDGNIVLSEDNNKNKPRQKRPISETLYTNRNAMKGVNRSKSSDGIPDSKEGKSHAHGDQIGVADDKENQRKHSHFSRFGFGSSRDKMTSNKFKNEHEKGNKLHKSYSYQACSSDDINNRAPLKKANSLPGASVVKSGKSRPQPAKSQGNQSDTNRFIDTKGPDKPGMNKFIKKNITKTKSLDDNASENSNDKNPAKLPSVQSRSLPGSFVRRNALPVRGKENVNKATEVVKKSDSVEYEASDRTDTEKVHSSVVNQENSKILIKPSYNVVNRDDDKVLESRNVPYKSSTLPIDNIGSNKNDRGQSDTCIKPDNSGTNRKFNSLNRFGFVKKDKINDIHKGTKSKELQKAERCTLKIYRKYDVP